MKKLQKLFVLISLCAIIFIPNVSIGFAYENNSITEQNEIEIPHNLYLEINENCKGHKSLEQADANAVGDFVVFGSEVYHDKEARMNIYRNFADIYDSDGNLICELSFKKCICAARISNDAVFIIFKNNVLTCDLKTKETHFYETSALNLWANGATDIIQTQKFTSGNNQYKMSSGLLQDGYNKLVKFSENRREVVLEYNMDSAYFIKQTISYTFLFVICSLSIVNYIFRRKAKERKKHVNQDTNQQSGCSSL